MDESVEIKFSTKEEARALVEAGGHVLVNAFADWCPHCQELKSKMPDLIALALAQGIKLVHIRAEKENEEFFAEYKNETLPYTFVFADGQFVGGDSFDENGYRELLHALAGVSTELG